MRRRRTCVNAQCVRMEAVSVVSASDTARSEQCHSELATVESERPPEHSRLPKSERASSTTLSRSKITAIDVKRRARTVSTNIRRVLDRELTGATQKNRQFGPTERQRHSRDGRKRSRAPPRVSGPLCLFSELTRRDERSPRLWPEQLAVHPDSKDAAGNEEAAVRQKVQECESRE